MSILSLLLPAINDSIVRSKTQMAQNLFDTES